jgi:hypothetical protein
VHRRDSTATNSDPRTAQDDDDDKEGEEKKRISSSSPSQARLQLDEGEEIQSSWSRVTRNHVGGCSARPCDLHRKQKKMT